jgi:hypothetical protein
MSWWRETSSTTNSLKRRACEEVALAAMIRLNGELPPIAAAEEIWRDQ